MRSRPAILALLALLLAPPALAGDPAPVTVDQLRANADELAAGTLQAAPPPAPAPPRSPLQLELAGILEAEAAELAGLLARLDRAASPAEERQVEREIDTLRQRTELELLRAQLRHAQANGEPERAAAIAQAIQHIVDPPRPVAPRVEREVQR